MGTDRDVRVPTSVPRIPWSDNRRRWICRCAFLLLCVFPTAALLYLILHPFSARDWEQLIEAKLGLPVTIGAVDHPGPWQTILYDVTVLDSAEAVLVKADRVDLDCGGDWGIEVAEPIRLTVGALEELVAAVRRHRGAATRRDLRIALGRTEIAQVEGPRVLEAQAVELQLQSDRGGMRGKAFLKTSTPSESEQRGIAIEYRQAAAGETGSGWFRMETQGEDLPCWILTGFLPELETLGAQASFFGRLTAGPDPKLPSEPIAQCEGHFRNCDLAGLSGLAFELSGTATVAVRECHLRDGRIENLRAEFRCQNGTLGPRFFELVERRLGIASPGRIVSPVRYSEFAGEVLIDRGKVQLAGMGPWWATDVDHRGLLTHPPRETLRLEDLAEWLFDGGERPVSEAAGDRQIAFLRYFHLPDPLKLATQPRPDWR